MCNVNSGNPYIYEKIHSGNYNRNLFTTTIANSQNYKTWADKNYPKTTTAPVVPTIASTTDPVAAAPAPTPDVPVPVSNGPQSASQPVKRVGRSGVGQFYIPLAIGGAGGGGGVNVVN